MIYAFCGPMPKAIIIKKGIKVQRLIVLSFLAVMVSVSIVHAVEPEKSPYMDQNWQSRKYTVTKKEVLEVSFPTSWADSIKSDIADLKEIMIGNPKDNTFIILLQVKGNNGPEFDHPNFIPQYLNQLKKLMRGKEAEANLSFIGIQGPELMGLYYSLEIPPREGTSIRYLTRGAAKTGSLLLTFTILTVNEESDYLKAGLNMIRSARYLSQR